MLLALGQAVELDAVEAARRAVVEQLAEQRIAIEPWEAAPDDGTRAVDQGADGAVADDAEVEGTHVVVRAAHAARAASRSASQVCIVPTSS
jgi:hypothetical protein